MPEATPPELRKRVRGLNEKRAKTIGADYVLCWLQQNLRAADNPIIDAAIAAGNKHKLPVVVYHALGQKYAHANARIHRFIVEAASSLAVDVEKRGLRFINYIERPAKLEKGLVYKLAERAAMIFTDDVPASVARFQAERVAAKINIPLFAVDASCLVPMNEFPFLAEANPFFRRAHTPLREQYLVAQTEMSPDVASFTGDFDFDSDDLANLGEKDLSKLVAACDIDQTVLAIEKFKGTRDAALAHLKWAMANVLPVYDQTRNNSSHELTGSRLSPYLHFGVLSVREIARAVHDQGDSSARARWKFLDEMVGWREFFHHTARHSANPADYQNLPEWAQETLAKHKPERRDYPTLDAMIHGETDDETWNAAQKQYLFEGWMPNNLRMYWGKKLVGWTDAPERAWAIACYLNDRFSLDGRDAATYGNLQWAFGRFDRPASEAAIYGTVARRGASAMHGRAGMNEWIAAQTVRKDYRVAVPSEIWR